MLFDLTPLTLIRTRWNLEPTSLSGLRLNETALRGAFLKTYRKTVCPPSLFNADCGRCNHLDSCSYGQVFAARPASFDALRGNRTIPRPYLFRVLPDRPISFELTLFGEAAGLLPRFAAIIEMIGETGIHLPRGRPPIRFTVSRKTLHFPGEPSAPLRLPCEPRSVQPWINSVEPLDPARLTFVTPMSIKDDGRIERRPVPAAFFRRLRDRLSLLASAWCGTDLGWDYQSIPKLAHQIVVVDEDLHFIDTQRRSGTTGHLYFQSGFIGSVVWRAIPPELWPLIMAGTLAGVGKGCPFGGGRYSVETVGDSFLRLKNIDRKTQHRPRNSANSSPEKGTDSGHQNYREDSMHPISSSQIDPWNPDLDEQYLEAVRCWLEMTDPGRISTTYESTIFPLALARMEREAAGSSPFDLLILPVGTQPFSPRLAATRISADTVGLIATNASLEIARDLAKTLENEGTPCDIRLSEFDGVSREEVAVLATRIYKAAGEPDPARTIVDLTSGRKPTVAALASFADALGAFSCYLEAKFHRHPHGGFATQERFRIDQPLALGTIVRTLEAARALAGASFFEDAAIFIGRQGGRGYLAPDVRAARHLFSACAALLENDGPTAERAFLRALRELPPDSRPADALRFSRPAWRAMKDGDRKTLDAARSELRRTLTRRGTARFEAPARGSRIQRRLFRPIFRWLMDIQESP